MGVQLDTTTATQMHTLRLPAQAKIEGPFNHLATQRDHNLLTALMLLGARVSPELEQTRDQLVLAATPTARITSLLTSAILEDSKIFNNKGTLFTGVFEGKWINVRVSTFQDKKRIAQILEAADPRGIVWPDLCGCSSLQLWLDTGSCELLVRELLGQCNIEYELYDHFIQIDREKLFKSLACGMLAAPESQVDSLYAVLFSPETLRGVADTMQDVVLEVSRGEPEHEDLITCLKILVGFVSVFFGTGIVLGRALS